MRCKNCGWNNPSGKMVCEKCNSSLDVSEIVEGRKTLREISGVKSDNMVENDIVQSRDNDSVCKNCGYPIMPGSLHCPQCGANAEDSSSKSSSVADARKTILPGRHSVCTLKFISEPNENISEDNALLSFSGSEIILNRGNTEPNNNTITSKEQARLVYENHKWYIQDKSELQTTYVRPGEKIEIKDGDVILLGDRRFRFNS